MRPQLPPARPCGPLHSSRWLHRSVQLCALCVRPSAGGWCTAGERAAAHGMCAPLAQGCRRRQHGFLDSRQAGGGELQGCHGQRGLHRTPGCVAGGPTAGPEGRRPTGSSCGAPRRRLDQHNVARHQAVRHGGREPATARKRPAGDVGEPLTGTSRGDGDFIILLLKELRINSYVGNLVCDSFSLSGALRYVLSIPPAKI